MSKTAVARTSLSTVAWKVGSQRGVPSNMVALTSNSPYGPTAKNPVGSTMPSWYVSIIPNTVPLGGGPKKYLPVIFTLVPGGP